MTTLSLKELKAENAKLEETNDDVIVDDVKEDIKDEYVEVDDNDKVVDKESDDSVDASKDEVETESWMQTEDAGDSEDDTKSGFVPSAKHAAKRKDFKSLKADLRDTSDENAELKARIAALEGGNTPQAQAPKPTLGARPTREQFDFDDNAYDVAVDEWNDAKFDLKLNERLTTNQQSNNQEQAQQKAQQALQNNLSDHYERASKLVESGKVTAESFKSSDKMVRLSLDSMSPGNGENITNSIISTLNSLGEGSEKVMYQLGVNETKMSRLQSLLITDPSGLSAVAYLGQLHSQVQTPSKRRSQAAKPSANADGETGSSGKAGTLQKQYAKSTDPQERVTMKRKARSNGIDVSNW